MSQLTSFTEIEDVQRYLNEDIQRYLKKMMPRKSRIVLSYAELYLVKKCNLRYPICCYSDEGSGYVRKDRVPTNCEIRRRINGMRKREGYVAAKEMDEFSRIEGHSFADLSEYSEKIRQCSGINLLYKNWKYSDVIRFAAAENDISGKSEDEIEKMLFFLEV